MRRGPIAFNAFINALKLLNRSDIIDKLNIHKFEESFSNLGIKDESENCK